MKHRDLDDGDVFPASLLDALQEFVGTLSANFRPIIVAGTQIQVSAGVGAAQVAVGFGSAWRYIAANATATHPGGAAGVYDLHAVASANDFDPVDETDYTFGLRITTAGGTPSGTHNGNPITLTRKLYEMGWDGAAIIELRSVAGGTDKLVGPWVPLARQRQTWQASYGAVTRWPDGLGGGGIPSSGGSWTAAQPPPEFWTYKASDEVPGHTFQYRFVARVMTNTGGNTAAMFGMTKMPVNAAGGIPAATTAAAILAPNLASLMPPPYSTGTLVFASTAATVVTMSGPAFTLGGDATDGSVWCLVHNYADTTANNFHALEWELQRRLVAA